MAPVARLLEYTALITNFNDPTSYKQIVSNDQDFIFNTIVYDLRSRDRIRSYVFIYYEIVSVRNFKKYYDHRTGTGTNRTRYPRVYT